MQVFLSLVYTCIAAGEPVFIKRNDLCSCFCRLFIHVLPLENQCLSRGEVCAGIFVVCLYMYFRWRISVYQEERYVPVSSQDLEFQCPNLSSFLCSVS